MTEVLKMETYGVIYLINFVSNKYQKKKKKKKLIWGVVKLQRAPLLIYSRYPHHFLNSNCVLFSTADKLKPLKILQNYYNKPKQCKMLFSKAVFFFFNLNE